MQVDKRKSPRRSMHYTAWISQEGKALEGCALADISDTGARLNVENPKTLPDEFVLFLSSRGSPRRKCKIAWRSRSHVGVQFNFPLSAKATNGSMMRMLAAKRAREVELAIAEREAEHHAEQETEQA